MMGGQETVSAHSSTATDLTVTAGSAGRFGLPAGVSPTRLLRALRQAGYLAGPPEILRFECLFLETQDGRLAKAGYRLSLRRVARKTIWHLAGLDGQSQGPYPGDLSFRSLSPEATGIPPEVRELTGDRLLLPLVRLRLYTWEVRLQGPEGSALSLSAERFTAAQPAQAWPTGPWPHGLLTLRLLEGDPDASLHLTAYLRDRLGLPETSGDACHVALQALGLPEPGAPVPAHLRIRPEDPLALAARKIVGQQLQKISANVTGTLEDLDPEYLHDLRVAIRRLRSALRLFGDVLGSRRCDSLRSELAWIGRLMGAVRDLDVFSLNLEGQAQRLGESGDIAALLVEELRRRRVPAREALVTALVSRRFRSLLRRLEVCSSSPLPRRPRGDQHVPVAEAAPALIRLAQKRVLRLGRTIGQDSPDADLHRLRILCKRLRYACEFFKEAFADPASGADPLKEYIEAMVQFQDCLGEHQDAVVAMARIRDLGQDLIRHGGLAPERLMDLGGLIQVQREIVRERRGRLAKLWARFDRRSVRKRLDALGGKPPQASEAGEAPEMAPT
jgi:CHAD domain-containing protein